MANKFKAAEERQKVRPGGSEPIPPVETAPVVAPAPEPVVETPTPAPIAESGATHLADMIEKKENVKACGFTLSPSSIKKLDKAAKQLKCSKSKALDLLIQKYL